MHFAVFTTLVFSFFVLQNVAPEELNTTLPEPSLTVVIPTTSEENPTTVLSLSDRYYNLPTDLKICVIILIFSSSYLICNFTYRVYDCYQWYKSTRRKKHKALEKKNELNNEHPPPPSVDLTGKTATVTPVSIPTEIPKTETKTKTKTKTKAKRVDKSDSADDDYVPANTASQKVPGP